MATVTADQLKEQGIELYNQYDYEAAARIFQEARDAYAADGRTDMVAEMKVNIGLTHRALGEAQQSLELMQEALRVFEEMDDKMRMAQVLGNLGGTYVALNDKEQAELSYRQAAVLFDELGENELYAETMATLSSMQMRGGRLVLGSASYQGAMQRTKKMTFVQRFMNWFTRMVTRLTGTPTP